MSLKLSKSLVKQGLALSVTALMMTAANAASSEPKLKFNSYVKKLLN